MKNPYLSIVIVGRNDNYGENFLLRINTFIKSLDFQLSLFPNKAELIVVEWNPMQEFQALEQVLFKPKNICLRIITVPNKIHEYFDSKLPLLEFYGKNVGIRRANGKFVLITNPDILFSAELIREIMSQNLSEDTYYRTDRYDYNGNGIENIQVSDFIDFATRKSFLGHLNTNSGSIVCKFQNIQEISSLPKSDVKSMVPHTNACGDFILASKYAFEKSRGLLETTKQKWHLDSFSLLKLVGLGFKQYVFTSPKCIFHMDHARSPEDVAWDPKLGMSIINNPYLLDSEKQQHWGLENINLTEKLII